jgi:3-hydroxyisobutyrate dehydrogenase-like beta-hydroxyacid dehydrogenase
MRIGFVGLGGMGSAMAARLVKAGHRVRVWNRSPEKAEKLVAEGAEAAASPFEVVEAEVVITMLADDAALRETLLGTGLLERMRPGTIHAGMATVSVELVRELVKLHEERGAVYVSAPVLGRPDAAAAGRLHILAAGQAEALAAVQPLFDVLGQKTWHFGDRPEQANVVKIAANFTLASAIEAMSEASQLARSYGVPAKDFLEMLGGTLFAAPAYKTYGSLIAEERFSPAGFKMPLGLKDVKLALAAGEAARVPLPFGSVLRDSFLDAMANGDAELDWSAVARVAQRRAGVKTA